MSLAPRYPLNGACLCGKVRFSVAEIFDAGYCHCNLCKKGNGTPVLAWAHVPGQAFKLVQGQPSQYRSSEAGYRAFCGTCGSPLYFVETNQVYYSVNIGVLDEPSAVLPRAHMCIESQLPWLDVTDRLPRFLGNKLSPPAKRDLEFRGLFKIQSENVDHRDVIHRIHQLAFGGSAEAELVRSLREQRLYSGDMSLVGVHGGTAIGHVLFSEIEIGLGPKQIAGVALAPLAVDPKFQNRGVGSCLVLEGLRRVKALGYDVVLVVGEPRYYERFGFSRSLAQVIKSPYSGDYFLGKELEPGALAGQAGWVATYSEPFSRLE